MKLSVYFIRHGIREIIKQYSKDEFINTFNNFKLPMPEQTFKALKASDKTQLLQITAIEKQKIVSRIDAMKSLIENVDGVKKDEIDRVMQKYEETLVALDKKVKDLESITGLQSKPDLQH